MKQPIKFLDEGTQKLIEVPADLKDHISTFAYCYLQPNGYFEENPSNEQGYTPWYTYPAIEFLSQILDENYKVLEYGCGYSSLYYQERVKELHIVEHNIGWAEKLSSIDNNLNINLIKENTAPHPDSLERIYEFVKNFKQVRSPNLEHDVMHGLVNNEFAGYASYVYIKPKGYFDVIVIDGMARLLTGYLAAEMIADEGYLILDNSDRWHYNTLLEYLDSKGFGRIDFWGPGWNNYHGWCTSFFSKNFKIKNKKLLRDKKEGPIII